MFNLFAQVAQQQTNTTATTVPDQGFGLLIQVGVPALISLIVALLSVWALLSKYRQIVDTAKEDIKNLKDKNETLKTNVDQLLEFKTQAQKFIDKSIYKEQSPLSLTDFGKKLVKESGFEEIFEQVKDNLVEMLESKNPSSQYETQEKARALMDELTTYQPFKPIEKYAFEHGKDLSQILRAGAILLRDYYFERHPEIVDPKEDW